MTNAEKLSNAFQALPAELRPTVAKLLGQVAHDLQSPLSTLGMEVFSIRMLLDQASSGGREQNTKLFANFAAISSNMERVSNQLAEYLSCLASLQTNSEESPVDAHDRDHSDRR